MERFQELKELSKKKIHIADHILTQTYPLINDAKLLLAVLENIFLALNYAMSSLLYYERFLKRIPPFQDNFISKINMFRTKCVSMYNFKKEQVLLIQDLREILISHKKSPVEFQRRDRFVICTENYNLKTISFEQAKSYLNLAKPFINYIELIVSKEEGIINK